MPKQTDDVKHLKVPDDLKLSLFFVGDDFIFFDSSKSFEETLEQDFFAYDIYFRYKLDIWLPWINHQESIQLLLRKWKVNREELDNLFKNRKSEEALKSMIHSINYFLCYLYWSNGENVKNLVKWESEIEKFALKPINSVERLRFIMKKPNHYSAFIQLVQLFEEYTKIYYKKNAIKK
ncbi:GTPase [Bacillus timonensis]|nr:GTPase [Bacillus timonensis]